MSRELQELCDVDLLLVEFLSNEQINTEEVTRLVDKREQLLQVILQQINIDAELKRSPLWIESIERTKFIVERMQGETTKQATQLRKFRHGNRSVQQYKKFL